jgi:hypothetical protein
MFARLARNKVTQCHAIKSRVNQALARPNASVMTGNMPMRMSSAMQLSGIQMNNKMFITSSVLEKQVSIMKN